MSKEKFDHINWRNDFQEASSMNSGFRELRAEIFKGTIEIVKSNGYYINNKFININNKNIITEYFNAPKKLMMDSSYETKFSVMNSDCLETAQLLLNTGLNPCVLNMANRQNPGGGVLDGAGAQEENIFRRSNLFMSLYQFAPYAKDYGINKSEFSYPLNRNTGGVYSGNITVFRGSEKNGYCLLKNPYSISFVTVPAINHPNLIKRNNKYYIDDSLIEPTKEKIRTILRIAGKFNNECLVLSAFGCGAFANPPNHIAELFKEVFSEKEFLNKFRIVVFSIFENHNSGKEHNPQGNVLPFLEVFDQSLEKPKKPKKPKTFWSKGLIKLTEKVLTDMPIESFIQGFCVLKSIDHHYHHGKVLINDVLDNRYIIRDMETNEMIAEFDNVDSLIEAGWVVD